MDRDRFDALTRFIASRGTRRGILGALASVPFAARQRAISAASDKAKGKGHDKSEDQEHGGQGQGHQHDDLCAELNCHLLPVPEGERPEFCCKGGFCSCGGACCPETECFQTGLNATHPQRVFCCTGPKLVICVPKDGIDPRAEDECCKGSCAACDDPQSQGIAGSYRRPR